jgi:hypothetical protein
MTSGRIDGLGLLTVGNAKPMLRSYSGLHISQMGLEKRLDVALRVTQGRDTKRV